MDGGYQNLVKEAKRKGVYRAADSFVNRDMVIPEEFVQAYINNPDDTNDMLREKLKDDIRDDMLSKDRDILYRLGMGIDYFSDDEIDTVIDSVLEYDKSDIAGAMAKTWGHEHSPSQVFTTEKKRVVHSILRINREMSAPMNGSMNLGAGTINWRMNMDSLTEIMMLSVTTGRIKEQILKSQLPLS